MLDIKQIVAKPEEFKKRLSLRKPELAGQIDEVLAKYTSYKTVLARVEELRAKRNELSKSIGKIKKEQGDEAAKTAMAEVGKIKAEMAEKEAALEPLKKEVNDLLLSIPNMPNEKIPVGVSDADNPEYIPCSLPLPKFDFKPLDHQAVGEKLGILDFEAAAALSGSRFALFKGQGARLERAIISFMLDMHAKKGYTEILPPVIVNEDILIGTGQLPKFREDMYELTGEPKQFLISTAEIPLTNLNRIRIVPEEELPIKLTAYSPCFRKESGTYGKDTRGLIRNHQFDKVELVMLSKPENSYEMLEQMVSDAQDVLKALEIPYHVVELCSGDIGFSSAKTYDIEVWMPSENKFREISSCSNCLDFQARRMGLRYKNAQGKQEYVHTLNGSGLAVGRTFAAILENFQQADGSVIIPKALRPYFGADKIEAKK
ncbi:serine--tRNA ligase [Candidatus Avelusimicrobium luingense]|uniref:serine--tRNA ligase n=1 Tax=Candidatus Avelusimicrobium luingense TaxID=3416211 RepID=UPI003D0BCBC3